MSTDRLRKALFWVFVSLTALFLLVPTLVIVPMSFTTTPAMPLPPLPLSLAVPLMITFDEVSV